ncbi:hypothetical protein [Kitasatospora sp. HPMI-4]|uniref:hypothetical protein n=1 Tax=Kitasatospora sp. HPMI-4 TaxID=3448443 RepID=UPI003F1D9611
MVVLDGLSAPRDLPMGCVHGTPWFVREVGTRLLAAAEAAAVPLDDALASVIREVNDLHRGTCALDGGAVPATTVTMLRESGEQLDYLVLSDSVLLLDGPDGCTVLTDKRVDDVAGDQLAAALALPGGTAEQAALVSILVTAQREVRNRPGGYWVASTEPEAARHAITGSVPRSSVHRAALLTDGATRLVDTFGELTWPELLDVLQGDGPAALIERTRRTEAGDPVGERWPRFKCSDDATAVCRTFATV